MTAFVEILFIALLILANGVLAMSELAVVSARRARLQQWAEAGDKGARLALELAEAPDRFLSTVQIGITLVGVMAGAFAGATLAEGLGEQLSAIPLLAPYSEGIGVGVVVVAITYLSLVFGELVPKRIALNNAEKVAARVAGPMQKLSVIARPIVQLLSFSTRTVTRILGIHGSTAPPYTRDELILMVEAGTEAGVLREAESDLVEHVFRLAESRLSALMTHRGEVVWLDIDDPPEVITRRITGSIHSRFPVAREDLDYVIGIAHAKDLLARCLAGEPLDLQALMHPPLFLPESTPALMALEAFRERRLHLAMVIDEYGGVQGLVTTNDVLEAIVGELPGMGEMFEPEAVQRPDGSWLLDGLLPVDEFSEILDMQELAGETRGTFETLGGFVMKQLGRIPETGDGFDWGRLHFEVVDMDGYRVDKVLVTPLGISGQDEHDLRQD